MLKGTANKLQEHKKEQRKEQRKEHREELRKLQRKEQENNKGKSTGNKTGKSKGKKAGKKLATAEKFKFMYWGCLCVIYNYVCTYHRKVNLQLMLEHRLIMTNRQQASIMMTCH